MIINGNSIALCNQDSNIPNMRTTLNSWYKRQVFTVMSKTIDANTGFVAESEYQLNFMGVIQPLGLKDLHVKPEGQRQWQWYMVHSNTDLRLNLDDRIIYGGNKYRVMKTNSFDEYGYVEYHIVRDFL